LTNTTLSIILVGLIILSAFFSAAETALMSVNRYRIRHLAKSSHRSARGVARLLNQPDKLLSVILLGNTFANVMGSAIATVIAGSFFGEWGILICSLVLTLVMLLFAEVTPKTLAAIHPLPLSLVLIWPLILIEKICAPLVWALNKSSLALLSLVGIRKKLPHMDPLNMDELRTLLQEAGEKIPSHHKEMLLAILDLGRGTVEDVMLPSEEVVGINLNEEWQEICKQITQSPYHCLPVFRDSLEKVEGMINIQDAMRLMMQSRLDKESLLKICTPIYYVPEATPLSMQLAQFQKMKQQNALVVDEYGLIVGLVTLDNIIEEIVGEMGVGEVMNAPKLIEPQKDGSYIVDGQMSLRELNRELNLHCSTGEARTLSGAIIEYLEMIPTAPMGLYLSDHPIEILSMNENKITKVRIISLPHSQRH
jgi:Mg2+/Co2+ transporter CorB